MYVDYVRHICCDMHVVVKSRHDLFIHSVCGCDKRLHAHVYFCNPYQYTGVVEMMCDTDLYMYIYKTIHIYVLSVWDTCPFEYAYAILVLADCMYCTQCVALRTTHIGNVFALCM